MCLGEVLVCFGVLGCFSSVSGCSLVCYSKFKVHLVCFIEFRVYLVRV